MEIMKFDNVKKTFEDGQEVIEALKSTSFSINAGELVAIIGPSGSGKSTLLTMMGGLQRPTEGTITFMDEDISTMVEKERNILRFDQIGFILQASNLVPFLTIEEQFELVDKFAGKKHDSKRAEELMKEMDIYKRKDLYPSDLSGGERQRAAICRALFPNPKLLLADEPTASLDTEKAIQVVELLKKITKDSERSTVMVTHDNRLLEYCDKVYRIVDGEMTQEK
ncbi:MAG: ABC transporter ATP-binding protein [Tissierellia bacterium]|nr:ABC transporter ATP-binding protein [Tissierellia bacterium]